MGGNVITLVTFYFILRIFFGGMMRISLMSEILGMYFHNCACHPAGFRIPAYMISDFKVFFHESFIQYKCIQFPIAFVYMGSAVMRIRAQAGSLWLEANA